MQSLPKVKTIKNSEVKTNKRYKLIQEDYADRSPAEKNKRASLSRSPVNESVGSNYADAKGKKNNEEFNKTRPTRLSMDSRK